MPRESNSKLFYELSKKITNIYFSNLNFKLKNDCACRLIADRFKQVSSVSILLYASNEDSLLNFGHYLNPKRAIAKFDDNINSYGRILKHIALYEYFAMHYEGNSLDDISLKDYISYSYFRNKYIYNESTFKAFRNKFATDYPEFRNYKKIISELDSYSLKQPQTMSGLYFYNLALGLLDEEHQKHNYSTSHNIKEKFKVLNGVYRDTLSVRLGFSYHYFALPLHANNRFVGIIRFLSHSSKPEENTKEDKELHFLKDKWPSPNTERELKELADMISLHIGNDFSSYEFKKQVRNELADYNEYARLLASTINSRGCIIRANINKAGKPELLGWTDTFNDYLNKLKKINVDHFSTYQSSLNELFKPTIFKATGEQSKIIAIQFDIVQDNISNVFYLYFASNEIVRMTNSYNVIKEGITNLEEIFAPSILSKTKNTDINQIMIVKIPMIENGYVTFGNTKFRPFSPNDLDVIYPQINRLGSELYVRQTLPLENKAELLGNIFHDLRIPIELAKEKASQLNQEIDDLLNLEFEEVAARLKIIFENYKNNKSRLPKIFEYLLNFIDSQFRLHKLKSNVDLNIKYKQLNRNYAYSLNNEIEMYIYTYQEQAHKENKIGIIKDFESDVSDILVRHNPELFIGLFLSLMSNAVQYSFSVEKRIELVPGYDQEYSHKTDGHIKVNCFNNVKEYGYSITNWGKRIPPDYVDKIFEFHQRGPIDLNVETEIERIDGEGIGLYHSKKFANLMGANIDLDIDEFRSTFKVIWKK